MRARASHVVRGPTSLFARESRDAEPVSVTLEITGRVMRSSIALIVSILVAGVPFACAPAGGGPGNIDGDGGTSGSSGSSGNNGGSAGTSMIPTVPGGPVDNPCNKPDAPPNCILEPSGPACGDGEINLTPPEACDDGNTKPGD